MPTKFSRVHHATSIRRTVGATAIGVVVGAGGLAAAPAGAEPLAAEPQVVLSFYDYPSSGDKLSDLAFFPWPEGREGGPLRGRLLAADGALKGPSVEVLSYDPGTVRVEAIVAGDIAELYDPATDVVVGRAVYDGKPELTTPLCAGTSSAAGGRTANEPIGNVEAFTPIEGAQHSGDIKLNPGTLATQAEGGLTWSATFERPLAAGDQVNVFGGAMRAGVRVQSFVQRTVVTCAPPAPMPAPQPSPTPAPAPDVVGPVGSLTQEKGAKKVPSLSALTKTGIGFSVTAQENATLKATLTLRTSTGKGKKKKLKEQVVGSATQPVLAGVQATVKLKAQKKAGSKIKKAAKQPGSKLVATITLTDAAGNVTTLPVTTLAVPKG